MPDRDVVMAIARDWLGRASDDLRAARLRLRYPDEMTASIAAFHAQQAAEKALKALLTRDQTPFPRTHDLESLHGLIAEPSGLPAGAELASLTPFAVEARYPDWPLLPEPTDADVTAAIELATRVLEVVVEELSGSELTDG